MKKVLYLLLCISALLFVSCKKCKTCQCWKSGVEYEETNCAYGFPPSTRSLEVWEQYLIEKVGYDSIKCKMD